MTALIKNFNPEKPEASIPKDLAEKIIHKIYGPDGNDVLWLCRF